MDYRGGLEGNFGIFLKCLLSAFCKATEKQNKTRETPKIKPDHDSLLKMLAQVSVNMKLIPTVTNFPHGYTKRVTLLDILGAYNQVVQSTSIYLNLSFLPNTTVSECWVC